jgi:hypothetical protein
MINELKRKQIEEGQLTCLKCKETKPLSGFIALKYGNGKISYVKSKCKLCYAIEMRQKRKEKTLNKKNKIKSGKYDEEYLFMKEITRKRGYLDFVDSLRLVHYHINIFGYKNPEHDLPVEDDLIKIYKDMYKVLVNYKPNN